MSTLFNAPSTLKCVDNLGLSGTGATNFIFSDVAHKTIRGTEVVAITCEQKGFCTLCILYPDDV